MKSPSIDAVYIPLPNSMHREFTILAAEHGKHVLCEKPLALNAEECEEMISSCQTHNVWLMEAFMYRFHPQIVKLKEIVNTGSIGEISTIRTTFRTALTNLSNIRYKKELGGGALYDIGCYCINIMRLLFDDEPTRIRGTARFNDRTGIDETFTGMLDFPGLKVGLFDCAFRSVFQQRFEVVGDRGTLELPAPFLPGASPEILKHQEGADERITIETANSYKLMAEHFNQCVLDGHPPRYPPTDGLNNMRVIDWLFNSVASSRSEPRTSTMSP
jgi:predicted dehydrogenase